MNRATRTILLVLAGLIGASVLAAGWVWREMDDAMDRRLSLSHPAMLTIAPGSNLARIARELETEGFVRHRWLFALRARLDGSAHRIKAGTYEVVDGDTLAGLLDTIVQGRTKVFHITFIEGCRFDDMRRTLAAAPYLVHTLHGLDDAALASALGVGTAALEGQFFPSTYQYEAYSEDRSILQRAYRRMQELLDEQWAGRAPDLPYKNTYEALIMASIVEKETGRADERAAIAGVFLRRLQRGMKLQTDPTVIYGLGDAFDGDLRRADLTRDTPYNSYTRTGLPPTPIAMPGEDAVRAALQPAAGDALYFVAKGDGSHRFSNSLREHNAAVRQFQLNQ